MMNAVDGAVERLGERIAIHIEKGELALAHRLVDNAVLSDCVTSLGDTDRVALNLAETTLSLKLVNRLHQAGIETIGDLLERSPSELLKLHNVSDVSLTEVYAMLEELGFQKRGMKRQPGRSS